MHSSIVNDLSLLIGQFAALLTAATAFWTLVKNKRRDAAAPPPPRPPDGGHSNQGDGEGS